MGQDSLPAVVYCDRVSLRACLRDVWMRRPWRGRRAALSVEVLDALPTRGWAAVLLEVLGLLGFRVREAQFFAGHLRTREGESVYLAARRAACELAFEAANRVLENAPLLWRLNKEWGRNTLLLHLARWLEERAARAAFGMLVADALARSAGHVSAVLILQRDEALDRERIRDLSARVQALFCGPGWLRGVRRRTEALAWWVRWELVGAKRIVMRRVRPGVVGPRLPAGGDPGKRSLVLLQEDDVSLDRSYRTQPHWLFPEDGPPPFRTLILQAGSQPRLPHDAESLEAYGVLLVPLHDLLALRPATGNPVRLPLHRACRNSALHAVLGPSQEVEAAFATARLFSLAVNLAALCERANVSAFMTCENYLQFADAMQLIAGDLGVVTLSYQYSNMSYVGPGMLTTADVMLTLAAMYRDRWMRPGVRPRSFVDIGYVFDSSFPLIRDRARMLRSRLAEAGAEFILCYFDENVQRDKYGCISAEEHLSEILALAGLVLDDPTAGVIIKTQFRRNSPEVLDDGLLARARATGRYVELSHGAHRNIIFAAEAALAADIVVGHAVGATAPLEAALAGVRALLVNPYGMRGGNDPLYRLVHVVYPTLADALAAVRAFRAHTPGTEQLGDWSSILSHFDSFRDGQAGHRLRWLLEAIVLRADRRWDASAARLLVDALPRGAPREVAPSVPASPSPRKTAHAREAVGAPTRENPVP